MNTFFLTVATVSKTLFSGEVKSLAVKGSGGDMVILAQHEPLISTLRAGLLTIVPKEGDTQMITIAENGVLEVSKNVAVVLV